MSILPADVWTDTGTDSDVGFRIPRVPLSLFLSVTSRCNQSCLHCAVYADHFTYGPDLTTDQWLAFIEHMADLKIFRVKISGGEPFVREDIFDILDALYEKPIRMSINTNATLIDTERARKIGRYSDKLDDVMVSLDGATAASHDALRGPGAFEAALEGIECLIDHVNNVNAYATVTRFNYRELEEITRLAADLELSSIKFNELLLEGRGGEMKDRLILGEEEKRQVMERLFELKSRFPFVCGTYLEIRNQFEMIEEVGPDTDMNGSSGEEPCLTGCGALLDECAVRPDGGVTPCDRLPELVAGNIIETPLDVIWRDSELFVDFRRRFTTPLKSLFTCTDCAYTDFCTGGCAASAYNAYGTTLAGDPACCYRRAIAKGK